MNKGILIFLFIQVTIFISAQQDTTKYPWPVAPVNSQKNISGTFGEYRSTSIPGHYHNGTDIPAPAGTPVYAVLGGIVGAAFNDGSTGYDSYVRITAQIDGKSKNITYYHTNPIVSVGQVISAGQQISTVAIDHVHLSEYRLGGSLSNSHLNAIRPDGGLLYYSDLWKPHIRYVKFLLDNSTRQLSAASLSGKVDIIAHVEEVNGTSASAENNGTYKIGYKVLSPDRQSIIYNPPVDGLRFEYYNIPSDSYVDVNYYQPEATTSKHVYIVTNGSGAVNVGTTQVVSNSYWDVNQFPYGNYVVMVFTNDTRGNGDTLYFPVVTTNLDLIPPAAAQFKYVKAEGDQVKIAWNLPSDNDLKGFRIYESSDGNNFNLKFDESVLSPVVNSISFIPENNQVKYYKILSVDTALNVSIQSDEYGIRTNGGKSKILIVDGFDRYSGSASWQLPYHNFVKYFCESFDLPFESCSNDEVISGIINLNDYNAVFWISGDESTTDQSFSLAEMNKLSIYLKRGGKLFVSGSEIAWDLQGSSSATQIKTYFLNSYLMSKYVSDDSNIYNVITQQSFPQFSFSYGITSSGSPYPEDYPDVIDTLNGSSFVLKYTGGGGAGIAYTGTFDTSSVIGQVLYFGFPFETVHGLDSRLKLMSVVLEYFGLILTDASEKIINPSEFILRQNFPNPFNPSTEISFDVPQKSLVKLKVFDALGREITELLNEEKPAGKYSVQFNASNLASGIYFYRLESGYFQVSKKMIFLK